MQELISPAQSDKLVLLAAPIIMLVCALWAWRAAGQRAALLAAVPGLMIYPLWMFHRWITRYDPQTGYFGLDKVWVLLLEVVLFVALGAIAGTAWSKLLRPLQLSTTEEGVSPQGVSHAANADAENANNNPAHRHSA